MHIKSFSKPTTLISSEYQEIKKELLQAKIENISRRSRLLYQLLLWMNILTRYYYKKGTYENKLKKDKVTS